MKKITVMVVMLFVTGMLNAALGEAIVTLKSGAVLRGEIISDTNDVLQIRAFNSNRTISSLRNFPRSDVQNVQIETPAEAAERIDYFALSKFQLDPDQEQSSNFYAQWTAAFEKFLTDYPKSDKATIIQQYAGACRAELKHLTDGEVKFANRWMTPEEKKPLVLAKQLAELENQRAVLAKTVATLQGRLQGRQQQLQTLTDTQEPVYETRLVGPNHYSQRFATGQTRTVPNPDRPAVLGDIIACQQQIASGAATLAGFDSKIQVLKVQIPQAQRAYEAAVAKANREAAQAATPPPPPQRPVTAIVVAPPPAAVAPESWVARNWKGLAIGGGILLAIVLILIYPLKRLLQKLKQAEAHRDEQRRVACANLKKLFDRIFAEGDRPAGPNAPEGRIVPIGKGEESYGAGRWFVIGDAHIWAVQNNGRDEDNWLYNNVTTKGRGAVGARIPTDSEWAEAIDAEANAAK